MPRVTVSFDNHIAHVCLTRADKMNALDQDMISAILQAGEDIRMSNARVVVLSGEGRAFCAGIDITGLGAMMGEDPAKALMPRSHGEGTTNQWQEVAMLWKRLPMPVIAALHGPVFGAGLQLALGADIRIAGADTQMAVMELKWGIVPDMGGMVLLPRLVASDVMRRLTYTATPVSAQQALSWGLITELAEDPLDAAMALAREITQRSPAAIRAAKALMAFSETAEEDAILLEESRVQAGLIGSPEQMEVVSATLQNRKAQFSD